MADVPYQSKQEFDDQTNLLVRAIANAFYNGDEEAAWQGIFETARKQFERGWFNKQTSRPDEAQIMLRARQ